MIDLLSRGMGATQRACADTDINEWLVLQGWAVAYKRYSHDYVRAETLAKAKRRGIWASEFVKPPVS